MCGIAGIVGNSLNKAPSIGGMVSRLHHRGPDGEGVHSYLHCLLGHTRLSIVDLDQGAQPMVSTDGKRTVVFNGEIYGYEDIRASLSYPFQTQSDTEVILALYEKYGQDLARHLPGMFALALWDEERQELFCARDRFGEKPLYFAKSNLGTWVFASEIKAILTSGLIEPKVSENALGHYLRYLYVHPETTIYENIHVLPAGCSLVLSPEKDPKVTPYWEPPAPQAITLNEAKEEFRSKLSRAVKRQMVADVEVGAFLSGGLDSSTIVSEAAALTKKLKTFAFGFEGMDHELPYARAVAKRYDTDHYELLDRDYDIASLLQEMARVYDEPFADSSNIPTYLISKFARKKVKVVLTGDGGDELLGGYSSRYQGLRAMASDNHSPLKKLFLGSKTKLLKTMGADWHPTYHRLLGERWAQTYPDLGTAFRMELRNFEDSKLNALGFPPPTETFPSFDGLDQVLVEDLKNYMNGCILVKTDRASMANSLELRAPFLDWDLAEFLISVPFDLKVSPREDKILLKEAYRDRWPSEIQNRPKQGFGAPVNLWLNNPKVAELEASVRGGRIAQWLPNLADVDLTPYQRWIVLSLGLWMEEHKIERA